MNYRKHIGKSVEQVEDVAVRGDTSVKLPYDNRDVSAAALSRAEKVKE